MVTRTLLILFLIVVPGSFAAHAQITVRLALEETTSELPGRSLLCDKKFRCGMGPDEQSKVSSRDSELLLKVSRTGKHFYLVVDSNQNGTLSDDRKLFLPNSGRVAVRIRKRVATGQHRYLPYDIDHSVYDEKVPTDEFTLTPRYVASGTLRQGRCLARLSVLDMNLDGRFNQRDSEGGTNLRIDRNNDGRYYGRDEHLRSAQIIEFCGRNYLSASLSNRAMVLTPTSLVLAKLNEKVPEFSMTLLDGKAIGADLLKGKHYILDFWASWCVPCVKNLPQIDAMRTKYPAVRVFSVNVDRAIRRPQAEKIIDEAGLREISVIRGLGTTDPIWKTFGGSNGNKLTIPLYVLVDEDAIVRYAGNGGEHLVELEGVIDGMLSTK